MYQQVPVVSSHFLWYNKPYKLAHKWGLKFPCGVLLLQKGYIYLMKSSNFPNKDIKAYLNDVWIDY